MEVKNLLKLLAFVQETINNPENTKTHEKQVNNIFIQFIFPLASQRVHSGVQDASSGFTAGSQRGPRPV